jgi:hypothetical protein
MSNEQINNFLVRMKIINEIEHVDIPLKGSHIALFFENLRFIGECMLKLNCSDATLLWCDLCSEINSNWVIEKSIEKELLDKLNTMLYGSFLSSYLNWEIHKSELIKLGINYSINPYEYIVKFFERGGYFSVQQGQVEIGFDYKAIIGLRYIKEPLGVLKMRKFAVLDDVELNRLDLEYQKEPTLFKENTILHYREKWDEAYLLSSTIDT